MRDTSLLLEGVPPERITVAFLVDVMDLAEDYGLRTDGVSIIQRN